MLQASVKAEVVPEASAEAQTSAATFVRAERLTESSAFPRSYSTCLLSFCLRHGRRRLAPVAGVHLASVRIREALHVCIPGW